ncbi:MAG TPA: hypothetical protein VH164_11260, partial [Ktedonobacteraceae bacterium]|nr:hypothetical protein [Ktedonobacteraceae bacterium]
NSRLQGGVALEQMERKTLILFLGESDCLMSYVADSSHIALALLLQLVDVHLNSNLPRGSGPRASSIIPRFRVEV